MTMVQARPITPTLLPEGTWVRILNGDGPPTMSGRIVGFGTMTPVPNPAFGVRGEGNVTVVYLVQLERGFYTDDRASFIQVLPVHPDGVDTDVPFCTAHQAHNCPFDQD